MVTTPAIAQRKNRKALQESALLRTAFLRLAKLRFVAGKAGPDLVTCLTRPDIPICDSPSSVAFSRINCPAPAMNSATSGSLGLP